MAYNSLLYLIFFAIVFLLYFIFPKRWRWGVLLAGSIFFYIYSSKALALFLLGSIASIYAGGLFIQKNNDAFKEKKGALDKSERKTLKEKTKKKNYRILTCIVVVNIGILAFLKYFNFIGGSFNEAFNALNLPAKVPVLKLVLPLGISFYTLQAISYIVDVYRGKIKADRNFGRLMLFMSFFPQMVEGPIGRYDVMAPQLYQGNSFRYENLQKGLYLIVWGFIKKMVLADRCAILVNTVFDDFNKYSGGAVAAAVILYTIQIYAEFSGVMDIVNGSAKILGIDMMENFRQPFFSGSVQEFWRRWHITLGAWLRDYVFYSVSFSKKFVALNKKCKEKFSDHFGKLIPMAVSLFCVWFLNGIWHGASWKYIFYGLYYYLILMMGKAFEPCTNKLTARLKMNPQGKSYRVFQILRTCLLVCCGMLIFRADSVSDAASMFASLFHASATSITSLGLKSGDFIVIAVCTVLLFVYSLYKEKGTDLLEKLASLNPIIRIVVYMVALYTLIIFGIYGNGAPVSTFIYGQF